MSRSVSKPFNGWDRVLLRVNAALMVLGISAAGAHIANGDIHENEMAKSRRARDEAHRVVEQEIRPMREDIRAIRDELRDLRKELAR